MMTMIGVKVTAAQHEAFSAGRDASGLNNSDYLLGLIAADCDRRGIDWPDDKAQQGGNRKRLCPICDSILITDPFGHLRCDECGMFDVDNSGEE